MFEHQEQQRVNDLYYQEIVTLHLNRNLYDVGNMMSMNMFNFFFKDSMNMFNVGYTKDMDDISINDVNLTHTLRGTIESQKERRT